MKNNFIAMGEYYRSNDGELVKTICRGRDISTDTMMVAFSKILDGGIASEVFFMPEIDFKTKFIS